MSCVTSDAKAVRRATWVGLIAVLCWSATIGLMRSIAEALGALGGAAALYSMAAAWVLMLKGVPSWGTLRRVSGVYLLLCGLLFALYEICLSLAIGLADSKAQSIELGMINYLWPCLTIVLAVLCRQEQARWWMWLGVMLCLWGLTQVVGEAGSSDVLWWSRLLGNMANNPLAYAFAFGAALLWPVYSVLARMYGSGFNGVGLFMLLTALLLWLQWLVQDAEAMQWSWGIVGQLLLCGALTALGYGCWEFGIQRGNLAVLATGSYFTPVLSALWASAWLEVDLDWSFWQGVALICIGSMVCWCATQSRQSDSCCK